MKNSQITPKNEIIEDFARRKALIDEEAFLERELKREERRLKAKGSVRRSSKRPENEEGFMDEEDPLEAYRKLKAKPFGKFYAPKATSFFTTSNVLCVFSNLVSIVEE